MAGMAAGEAIWRRGGGKIGHASFRCLLFPHGQSKYDIFLKLLLMAAPVAELDWGQDRTGSLKGRPDALRDALAADRADL